jgi:hypothetical protein
MENGGYKMKLEDTKNLKINFCGLIEYKLRNKDGTITVESDYFLRIFDSEPSKECLESGLVPPYLELAENLTERGLPLKRKSIQLEDVIYITAK